MNTITVKSINDQSKTYQFIDNGEPMRGGVKDVYFSPCKKYVVALFRDKLDFNQKDMKFTIAGDAPSKVSEFIEKNLGKKIKLGYVMGDGCAFCVYSAE